jgi:hypothetical protein
VESLSALVRSTLATLTLLASLLSLRPAVADNAAFALAPKDATIAIDARAATEVLGTGGEAVRTLLSVLAGERALETFDALARRTRADVDVAAKEVFAGRVVFYAMDSGRDAPTWMFGVEADDARCERVLKMLGARMHAPGRFTSNAERLLLRRVGGWLLMSPIDLGEAPLDEAAARIVREDPAISLLGDPLMQAFLGSDAPVRIFLRHDAPVGGATTIGLTRTKRGIRAELRGNYDASPLGAPAAAAPLDERLVSAFDDAAVLVLVNPTDGRPSGSDVFWLGLVPELAASPAMRSNLAGERLLAIGVSNRDDVVRPAIALAWRVEDVAQADAEQDLFMHNVCCGMVRALEPKCANSTAGALTTPPEPSPAQALTEPHTTGARTCEALGPFADRYLGTSFKLGRTVLCWSTVSTHCGGWQVYASDERWLETVGSKLKAHQRAAEPLPPAAGFGFCDGRRAANLIRAWQPLVEGQGPGVVRLQRGLEAVATALEGVGKVSFRYETPSANTLRATVDIVQASRAPAAPGAGTEPRR